MANWKNINSNFTEELQKAWEIRGFDYNQTKEWINIGLQPTDYNFANYLQNNCGHNPESILNEGNVEKLKKEYQEELAVQEAISNTIIESETQSLFGNWEETQLQEALSQSLLISQTETFLNTEEDSQLQETLVASAQQVKVEKLKKEIVALKNQLFYKEIIEEKQKELEKQVQVLTTENNSLRTELKDLHQQNKELRTQLQSFQSESAELKRNEFEKLISNIKNKLQKEDKDLVDDLLEAQKEMVQNNNSFAQRQLEKIKQKLLKKIEEGEINKLYQLYGEILEIEIKNEARIEVR